MTRTAPVRTRSERLASIVTPLSAAATRLPELPGLRGQELAE